MSYNRLIVSIVIFTVASLIKSCLTCDPSSDMVNCYYAFDERNFQTIKAFIDEPRLKYDVTMTDEVCSGFDEFINCYSAFLSKCLTYPYYKALRRNINALNRVSETLCSNSSYGLRELIAVGYQVEEWRKKDTNCNPKVDNQWPLLISKTIRLQSDVICDNLIAYHSCMSALTKIYDRKMIWSRVIGSWIHGLCNDTVDLTSSVSFLVPKYYLLPLLVISFGIVPILVG